MVNNEHQQTGLLIRYLVSGSIAAIVHFGLLVILIEWVAFHPTWASALGFMVAIFINYSLQFHWTFAVKGKDLHRIVFTRYLFVTCLTLCLNTLLFWSMNGIIGFNYLYSQIVATGIVLIINLLINQKYTFKQDRLYCRYDST